MTDQPASEWERKLQARRIVFDVLCRTKDLEVTTWEEFNADCDRQSSDKNYLARMTLIGAISEALAHHSCGKHGVRWIGDVKCPECQEESEQAHLAGRLQQKEIEAIEVMKFADAYWPHGTVAHQALYNAAGAIRSAPLPPASQEALDYLIHCAVQKEAELQIEHANKRVAAEGERVLAICLADHDAKVAETLAAEVRSAEANKAALAYIQETASHAMCHAETYTLEEAMNALYRIHQKLDDAAAIAAESPKETE